MNVPTILFGAFDRHNFGDLLLPHIVTALIAGKDIAYAGLAQRDLRPYGGHLVQPLSQFASCYRDQPVHILHVGGELLTCDAWEAAVMLLPPDQAQAAIARRDDQAQTGMEWASGMLGVPGLVPYTVGRELFPHAAAVIYNAVGGVDLGALGPLMRAEVLAKLKAADMVSVRDKLTGAQLHAAGITARLMPDAAVMVAELFGDRIRERSRSGEVALVLQAFPRGYIAVQFSADFCDDETLSRIAAQLDLISTWTGFGVVFFRAGAAPWHDELQGFRRVAEQMRRASTKIFESLNLWDICALIAFSRGYCGSSLHGRIVAMAFALPRMNILQPSRETVQGKHGAFAAAWEENLPTTVAVRDIAAGMRDALATDPEQRRRIAGELAARYRTGFAAVREALTDHVAPVRFIANK